jgi:lipid-A-disaccharide synthase
MEEGPFKLPLALSTRLRKAAGISRRSDSRDFKLVMIVAGEASADLHGSNLVKAMRRLDPRITFLGVGGKEIDRAGVEILFSCSDMAVVGLTEVLHRLPTIARASRTLKCILKNNRPDLLILIDYPDFNINLAKTAKRFKVPVLYYIGPQVWAWRKGRVRKIGRRVDRMAVILPFEEAFYRQRSIHAEFVGHPILDDGLPEWDFEDRGLHARAAPVIGLLPGSRTEEVRKLLPVMVDAAEILKSRYSSLQCLLPLAPTIELGFVKSFIRDTPIDIRVSQGNIYDVLGACDIAFVASGTATLQAGLMGVPMVLVYKLSRLSYLVGKLVIDVPHIGLINLVAGKRVVPELIQDAVTAERLAGEALPILENDDLRAGIVRQLKEVREGFGTTGASEKTAKIALQMMRPEK